ncbi:hypothetical protein CEXT_174771 [Caerostris extrusa]|uniref:Uncharacterized protein n=1 Tax=Caerostris extrusa TaxID=172846 RepID=A0AAV4XGD6_CAEEX|nr:hypothetical protein CEXT_174771 [Caerostris extrusa]
MPNQPLLHLVLVPASGSKTPYKNASVQRNQTYLYLDIIDRRLDDEVLLLWPKRSGQGVPLAPSRLLSHPNAVRNSEFDPVVGGGPYRKRGPHLGNHDLARL